MKWNDHINAFTIAGLLRELGRETRRNRLWPCPACGEEARSSSSRDKGPIGFGRYGWRCHRCGVGGGRLQLASWLLLGREYERVALREAWRARVGELGHRVYIPPAPARVISARPPIDEVRQLWNDCAPVTDDDEVAMWLCSRGLRPHQVALHDLARALPPRYWCPRWASFQGQRWNLSGHRLIVRAVGPGRDGWEWSLRARNILADVPPGSKSASVAMGPGSASGLVYADETARQMLNGSRSDVQLVITEGEPDWLTWSTLNPRGWGVLGIWSGAWVEHLADCIPRGAVIALRTHQDPAGQKYAAKIRRSLQGRTTLYQLEDGLEADENDRLQARMLLELNPLSRCSYRSH